MNETFPWPELALLALPPADLLKACERQPFQSSGAGGQKRNRTYSALRLVHPSGYRAEAGEYREAARNQSLALGRLRREIALALARKELDELLTRPDPIAAFLEATRDWPAFRYPVNEAHDDFANFIALAVVLLRLYQGQPAPAAERLGVSTSAFVKFCKKDQRLWRFVSELRRQKGLPLLR